MNSMSYALQQRSIPGEQQDFIAMAEVLVFREVQQVV
jgi:hypothetical protein